VNLSHVFAGQNVGVTQVGERFWLVTFMRYDLGYFDDETCRLEPFENPFAPKLSSIWLDLASGKKVWEYEAASPVTCSPPVAKGKVVVATADGQVICFGKRQTPTVDSLSPKGGHFPHP
jgi:outer membrane protein assembly factor BamB